MMPRVDRQTGRAVRRELTVSVGPSRVWAALTEELSAWFGASAEIEARPGGSVTMTWPDGTERRATVEEASPPTRLAFRWAPFERTPDGRGHLVRPTRVEFELRETRGGTLVTVTEEQIGAVTLAGTGSV